MRTCSIIGAGLLSLIAVPALAFAVLFYGFAQIVLGSPEFVAKLDPANIDAQIRKAAPYMAAAALSNPDDPDSQQLINDLIPDPAMQSTLTEAMPQLLDATNGDLSSESLANLDSHMSQIIDRSPPCSAEAEAAYVQALAGTGALPSEICRPNDPVLAQQVATRMTDEMRQIFDGITQAPLTPADGTPDMAPQVMGQDMQATVAAVRANAGQGFILPLTLIALVLLLAVRSLRSFLRWSGGIVLFAGLIGLGMAFTSGSILAVDWPTVIRQEFQGPEINVALIFVELLTVDAFGTLVGWMSTVSGSMAVGGGLALLVSAVMPRRPQSQMAVMANASVGAIPTMTSGTQVQDLGATQPIPTVDGERKE